MKHFFERRDFWGNHSALWVLVGMAFILPMSLAALRTLEIDNDVTGWLPKNDPQALTYQWYQEVFPSEDQILVSWDNSSLNDPRLAEFQRRLSPPTTEHSSQTGEVPYIRSVLSPHDVIQRMKNGGVSEQKAIEQLTGVLIGEGSLKVQLDASAKPELETVEAAIVEQVRDQVGLDVVIERPIPYATEETDGAEDSDQPTYPRKPFDFAVRWPGMHSQNGQVDDVRNVVKNVALSDGSQPIDAVFQEAGDPIALGVVLSPAHHGHTQDVIRTIREAAKASGIPPETVHMGGRAIAGSELNRKVNETIWDASVPWWQIHRSSPVLLSMLVSAVVVFFMLRSVRLTTLVLVATSFAVILSVSVIPWTGGIVSTVLVVMPPLLAVLTLSAAIHVANYWKHAAIYSREHAIVQACKMARQPCILASLTTAIGLVSLATSSLSPVKNFGLYCASGCVISLVVVLYGLPALLVYWPCKRPYRAEVEHTRWQQLADVLVDHWRKISLAGIAFFLVCVCGLWFFRTETKVIRYFAEDSEVVQDYQFLEDQLSGITPADILVRFSKDAQSELNFYERSELIRKIEHDLRDHAEVSGTISLADFLAFEPPSDEATGRDHWKFNLRVNHTQKRLREGDEVGASSLYTVAEAPFILEQAGGQRTQVFPGDEIWRITAQVSVLSERSYAELVGRWHDPETYPGDLNVIVQSNLKDHAGTFHVITGMVPLFLQTQEAVLSSLINSFGIAFCIIGVIMMILLRSMTSGLITMVPNVLPVGIVFGLISWYGLPVDIGTMVTASVALGIAVDGTLHLLTWFRKGILDGMSRHEAIARALGHCGPALWQTSATVAIGMLMLYPSELLIVSRFGWLMAALISAALVADLIVLPALLAGPLGALIERAVWQRHGEPVPVGYVHPHLPTGPHTHMVSVSPHEHTVID
ncbi:efflux RND transporter permease subunit [Thalassoroseus pseudoceratinae]|uniref:efflux RND transporter permease subunit n=1 Tax=Thalassoroseus pseudoceratinae TaxID=2713176 RepID=UPI001420009A|nr:MMPL family transporter [Thalassoroseus pseudoceratinae]